MRLWDWYFVGLSSLAERLSPIGAGPVWRSSALPWLKTLEARAPEIRAEIEAYLAAGKLMPDKEDLDPGRTSQYGTDRWEILHLMTYGERFDEIAAHFPVTMAAVEAVPNLSGIMFSRLPPERKDIPPHRDAKNGTLRMHLGLKVPAGACYIKVADTIVHWREGEAFALDASYEHSVRKDADEERILLIVDFVRPVPEWLAQLSYGQYSKQCGIYARKQLRGSYTRLLEERAEPDQPGALQTDDQRGRA